MATPTIPNGEEYFFPIIYEGNGAGQRVGKFVPFTDNGTIDNSCIFNRGDNPKLARTPSSDGNKRTWTLSFWAKLCNLGTRRFPFSCETDTSNYFKFEFTASNTIDIQDRVTASSNLRLITNRTFEDTSKYYHFMIAVDTTQSTASDRVKFYVDGDQVTSFSTETYPSQDYDTAVNSSSFPNNVGIFDTIGSYDGYLAEFNLVDGTALAPSTFGVTDTSTGRWIPKTLSGITYGTNGFRLKFQDSSALGDDTSGNGNDFTATNLASTDQTTDSPTQNHATFDSNRNGGDWTLSEGNLKIVGTPSTGAGRKCLSGMNVPNSNKIYWEVEVDVNNDSPRYLGIFRDTVTLTGSSSTEDMRFIATRNGGTHDGKVWDGTSTSSQLTTTTSGDIIQFARDGENLWIGKNNTWLNSGNPSTGANPLFTNIDTKSNWKMGVFSVSQGLPSGTSHTFIMNAGQKTFSYTPPTGFSAWNQDNLPETAKGVSGLVWTKNRDATDNHQWYDSSRGNTAVITSVGTVAETTVIDGLQKFLAGGQQIEGNDAINTSGESFVSWNWVGNGATEVTNTEGSVTTTVQANTTAGFSILKFTPPASGITDQTFGHGLTKAPEWFLFKRRDNVSTGRFLCFHKSAYDASNGGYSMEISSTNPNTAFNTELGASAAYPAAPTATTISMKNNSVLAGGKNHIAYCWHSVEGFSKFGKYVGNGSTDGPFIYTGFKPAWLMYKNINTASQWLVYDGQRNTFNPVDKSFRANASNAEETGTSKIIDFLSNGFKQRSISSTDSNQSGQVYIYMAFAEHPFVGDGTSPVTAR